MHTNHCSGLGTQLAGLCPHTGFCLLMEHSILASCDVQLMLSDADQ